MVAPTLVASQRQAVLAVTAGATAAAAWYNSTSSMEASVSEKAKVSTPGDENPIEIHLIDKISHKVYLNPSRTTTGNTTLERPAGVPSHLRLLAIDLPEMREQAFAKGTCRMALDHVFPDGVAPPKQLLLENGNTNDKSKKSRKSDHTSSQAVEQEALIQSLVKCVQQDSKDKVGVEIMEASFARLNPKNMRHTRQLGGYHYDPGKYTRTNSGRLAPRGSREKDIRSKQAENPTTNNTNKPTGTVEMEDQHVWEGDELEAPWNQYSWMEELKLRIHGQVLFGDALETNTRWKRYWTGGIYKQTVPAQRGMLDYFLPSFLQSSNPQGIDGHGIGKLNVNSNKNSNKSSSSTNWASNKPHAVIANGAAVQRVPGGLRMLQKTCRDANVPLFVLHDPRAWGASTHDNLHQALKDVRATVKQNIILQAMEHQSGFARGRRVGRMEQQVRHVTEKVLEDRQRRQVAMKKRQWNLLPRQALEQRLVEHGVVTREDRLDDGTTHRTYTPAFVQIAQQCVADEAERNSESQKPSEHPASSTDDESLADYRDRVDNISTKK